MPSVQQWQESLIREYSVPFDSSDTLCDEVYQSHHHNNQERRRRGPRPVRGKSITPFMFGGSEQQVRRLVRPIELLHWIGVVTTPAVSELVDLSSTWAEIRYLWSFRPAFGISGAPRSLRMNDIVEDLDFHQKTLLSDELGVGFGVHFMFQELREDPVDAYVAMKSGQYGLRGQRRRAIPDYIFITGDGNGYYVLECKGTQSGRATAINQLRRGTEQAQAVSFTPDVQVSRLVIAASLKDAITVYVIDPPDDEGREDDDRDAVPIEPLVRWAPDDVALFAAAKRLTYVGDLVGADKVLAMRYNAAVQ